MPDKSIEKCPHCHRSRYDCSYVEEVDENTVTLQVVCEMCSGIWYEKYFFTKVEIKLDKDETVC